MSAIWTPACDAGAWQYQYFVGVSNSLGLMFRARGTITMRPAPNWQPSTLPWPSWDGGTDNFTYATWSGIRDSATALQTSMQAGFTAGSNNTAQALSAAEQYTDQSTSGEAQARVALAGALSNAVSIAATNLQAGINAAATAGSNYAAQVSAMAQTNAIAAAELYAAQTFELQGVAAGLVASYSNATSNAVSLAKSALQGITGTQIAGAGGLTNAAAFDAAGVAASLVNSYSNATSNALALAKSALQSITGAQIAAAGGLTNPAQFATPASVTALTLGDALRTIQSDTNAWLSISANTANLNVVSPVITTNADTTHVVAHPATLTHVASGQHMVDNNTVSTGKDGGGYTNASFTATGGVGGGSFYLEQVGGHWGMYWTTEGFTHEQFPFGTYPVLPVTINGDAINYTGSVTVDWVRTVVTNYVTNTSAIATSGSLANYATSAMLAAVSNATMHSWIVTNTAAGALVLDWNAGAHFSFAPTDTAFSVSITNTPSAGPRVMEMMLTTPANVVPTITWPATATWSSQLDVTSNRVYFLCATYLGGTTYVITPVGSVNLPL